MLKLNIHGADDYMWVYMDAHGCDNVQQQQNEVVWARGNVCKHDSGPWVTGKFPDIMSRLILPKNKKNDQQTHRT